MTSIVNAVCRMVRGQYTGISMYRLWVPIVTLGAAIWMLTPLKPANAQDVCVLLDQVVAAAEDSPPFESARYLSAANAKCQVGDRRQHEKMGLRTGTSGSDASWLCIWDYETLEQPYSETNRVAEVYSDESNSEDTRHDQLAAQYDQLVEATSEIKGTILVRARKWVSSIQLCTHEGAIRGEWGQLRHNLRYSDGEWEAGQWFICQDSRPLCLELRAMPHSSQTSLGIFFAGQRN